ncbi:GrpB family protein [Chitinophaga vietnamensis]|uniref:GrpB family protein n=1 Tax=Chitinophaga vietnamensis TaxID=2593957 RepID=UPI001178018E|nr:GrpB family protein [Chitinophaga vietnamensis]
MKIEIIPYQARWPEEYKSIVTELKTAVGQWALAFDHIGSTSVPGLPAKDVIDIQMTVGSLDVPLDAPLAALGYQASVRGVIDHRPPGRDDIPEKELVKRMFFRPSRRVHLHVRVQGYFNQQYPLLCRDYLRTHPYAAHAYGEIKQQLARYFPDHEDAYYDIKDPVFDLIMEGAYEWEKSRGNTNLVH